MNLNLFSITSKLPLSRLLFLTKHNLSFEYDTKLHVAEFSKNALKRMHSATSTNQIVKKNTKTLTYVVSNVTKCGCHPLSGIPDAFALVSILTVSVSLRNCVPLVIINKLVNTGIVTKLTCVYRVRVMGLMVRLM